MESQTFGSLVRPTLFVAFFALSALLTGAGPRKPAEMRVALQPFAQQVRQVESALSYLGQPSRNKIKRVSAERSANSIRPPPSSVCTILEMRSFTAMGLFYSAAWCTQGSAPPDLCTRIYVIHNECWRADRERGVLTPTLMSRALYWLLQTLRARLG